MQIIFCCIVINVVICYYCRAVAGRADDESERLWNEEQEGDEALSTKLTPASPNSENMDSSDLWQNTHGHCAAVQDAYNIGGDNMKASKQKIQIACARACMSVRDIITVSGLPRATVNRAVNSVSVSPKTLGKIAKALGVDVLDIIELEDR